MRRCCGRGADSFSRIAPTSGDWCKGQRVSLVEDETDSGHRRGKLGTALGIVAARAGHQVTFWSRNPDVVTSINRDRVNSRYLPGRPFRRRSGSGDLGEALNESQLVIIATPSHATRAILVNMSSALPANATLVSATKGIEIDTGKRISQLVTEVLGESLTDRFVCLSGPSFAKEVVSQHPTAIVAAGVNTDVAATVQSTLSTDYLRIYTNDDVVGTELGGSVKNVMAIAAGMVAGLGFGANSVAALITRGLAEMSRLALAEGGKLETMMGLAGLAIWF